MMNTKAIGQGAVVSVALALLLGSNIALASARSAPTTQPLNFSVPAFAGAVQDLGNQAYTVSGGYVAAAYIAGAPLDPGATIAFNMNAQSNDLKTTGTATFNLQGTIAGVPVSATGQVQITSADTVASVDQAQTHPCVGMGAKACSELPVFFGGASDVQISTAGVTAPDPTVVQIENPYFNPFGGPIVISTADQAVVIVATYTVGNIQWSGTTVGGPLTGTLGTSTPVSGTLSLVSQENEDLVAGTATDSGQISFTSMSPSFLNLSGTYTGASSIPVAGSFDCSTMFGFPAGSGVCTETGFLSNGQYTMQHAHTSVSGTYSTTWTVPALAFTSTSSATVTH